MSDLLELADKITPKTLRGCAAKLALTQPEPENLMDNDCLLHRMEISAVVTARDLIAQSGGVILTI